MTTFSPSPTPGESLPQRRAEDTASNTGEWTMLVIALLVWATTFCMDMATYESFTDMLTPKFLGLHIGQLVSVTMAVIIAKRMK